jgi:molecular chaperone GrpE (heat shock protein)
LLFIPFPSVAVVDRCLKDSLLRTLADFENLQKVTARDKQQAKDYAIRSFASEIVSNLDVIQLALKSVPEAKRTDRSSSNDLADLYTGIALTRDELQKTLKRFGVESFDPTGEKFDPNRHEAMYQVPIPDKEPGTVLDCQKIGWMIRGAFYADSLVHVVRELTHCMHNQIGCLDLHKSALYVLKSKASTREEQTTQGIGGGRGGEKQKQDHACAIDITALLHCIIREALDLHAFHDDSRS